MMMWSTVPWVGRTGEMVMIAADIYVIFAR